MPTGKPLPFLHPARRALPQITLRGEQRIGRAVHRMISGEVGAIEGAAGMAAAKAAALRPAPDKVLRGLSSPDNALDTLSRFGRATRRQQKEFSAVVHPLSGRMMQMNASGRVGGQTGLPAPRQAQVRMARLADQTKNPEIRRRAVANLNGQNKNINGPAPIFAHNHPAIRGDTRAYPSSTDLNAAHQLSQASRGVFHDAQWAVVSPRPGPRGSKKTSIVLSRPSTPRSGPGTRQRERAVGDFQLADLATTPPAYAPRGWAPDIRGARSLMPGVGPREGRTWDGIVRANTTGPRTESGFRTRQVFGKRDVPFISAALDRKAAKVAAQILPSGTDLGSGVRVGAPQVVRGLSTPGRHFNVPGFRSAKVGLERGKSNVGHVTASRLPTGHVFVSDMAVKPSQRGKGVGSAALRATQENTPKADTPSVNFLASAAPKTDKHEAMTGNRAWRKSGVRFMPGGGVTGQKAYDAPRQATGQDAKRIKRVLRQSKTGRISPTEAFQVAPELEGASWYGQVRGGKPFARKTTVAGAAGGSAFLTAKKEKK